MAKKPKLNMTRALQGIRARRLLAELTSLPHLTISNNTFLRAMFGGIPPDEAAITCSFRGDPNDDRGDRKYKWSGYPWRQRGASGWALSNNFSTISTFYEDPETSRWKRLKARFARMCGLMIDDLGSKVSMARIILPLSAIIETSPANFQGWYFLNRSDASCDLETASATINAMIASGLTADGSDPGMSGVTRYGRLPVGINGKSKYVKKLGHPFQCGAVSWNPERRYTLEEIIKGYKLDLSPYKRRSQEFSGTSNRKLPRGEATRRVAGFERMMAVLADHELYLGQRDKWHDIICPWVDDHTDQEESGSALYEPAESNDWLGGYKCHHGHCDGRTVGDVYKFAHDVVHGES